MASANEQFDPGFVEWHSWPNPAGHTQMAGYVKVNPDGLHIEPLDDHYGGCIDRETAVKLARAILDAYEGGERIRLRPLSGGAPIIVIVQEETAEAWRGKATDHPGALCGLWPKSAWRRSTR